MRSAKSCPWIPCWVQPLTIWPRPLLKGELPVPDAQKFSKNCPRVAPDPRGLLRIQGVSWARTPPPTPRNRATPTKHSFFITTFLSSRYRRGAVGADGIGDSRRSFECKSESSKG